MLPGKVVCDGPITCLEKSYWIWSVTVCDPETSRMRRPWAALGCCASGKKNIKSVNILSCTPCILRSKSFHFPLKLKQFFSLFDPNWPLPWTPITLHFQFRRNPSPQFPNPLFLDHTHHDCIEFSAFLIIGFPSKHLSRTPLTISVDRVSQCVQTSYHHENNLLRNNKSEQWHSWQKWMTFVRTQLPQNLLTHGPVKLQGVIRLQGHTVQERHGAESFLKS